MLKADGIVVFNINKTAFADIVSHNKQVKNNTAKIGAFHKYFALNQVGNINFSINLLCSSTIIIRLKKLESDF